MNGRYLRELAPERLTEILEERHGREGLRDAVGIAQEKMQTLDDFWTLAAFLVERQDFDEKAWAKVMGDGAAERLARGARGAGRRPIRSTPRRVEAALRGVVERLGVKPKEVFQPVRVAISGTTVSPGIFESVAVLGRRRRFRAIDTALERLRG